MAHAIGGAGSASSWLAGGVWSIGSSPFQTVPHHRGRATVRVHLDVKVKPLSATALASNDEWHGSA